MIYKQHIHTLRLDGLYIVHKRSAFVVRHVIHHALLIGNAMPLSLHLPMRSRLTSQVQCGFHGFQVTRAPSTCYDMEELGAASR